MSALEFLKAFGNENIDRVIKLINNEERQYINWEFYIGEWEWEGWEIGEWGREEWWGGEKDWGVPTENDTVLHVACRNNHKDMVQALLTCPNIELDLKNNKGETPFDCTSDPEIRKLLRYPNIDQQQENQRQFWTHAIQDASSDLELPLTAADVLHVKKVSFLVICPEIDRTFQQLRDSIYWDQLLETNQLFKVLEELLNGNSVENALNEIAKNSPNLKALIMVQVMLISSTCKWRTLVPLSFAYLQSNLNEKSAAIALKGYLNFRNVAQSPQQRDENLIEALLAGKIYPHMQVVMTGIPKCFEAGSNLMNEAFMFVSQSNSKPSLKEILAQDETKSKFNDPKSVIEIVRQYYNQYVESEAFKGKSTSTSKASVSLKPDVVMGSKSVETPLFYVHSFVLKLLSEHIFNICCGTQFSEAKQEVKRLESSPQVLECLIRWMYTYNSISSMEQSEVDKEIELMFELIEECDMFFISGLPDAAAARLKDMVRNDPDSAVELVMIMKGRNKFGSNSAVFKELGEHVVKILEEFSKEDILKMFRKVLFEY
eukprot:gb/GECH01014169.1/.p1 GENE.gb/GECH01014169.1/~~gb/GECH01014169.1/.p1  ORF type:complete len:544 (+),score=114.56 gb/GECH01014169.1/:1-1632(+)